MKHYRFFILKILFVISFLYQRIPIRDILNENYYHLY